MLNFLALTNGVKAQRRRRDRDKRRAEKYFDKYAKCVKKKGKKDSKCLKYREKARKYLAKADAHDAKISGKSKTSIHILSKDVSAKGKLTTSYNKEIARSLIKERVDANTILAETGVDVTNPESDIYIEGYDEMISGSDVSNMLPEEQFEDSSSSLLTNPAVLALGAVGVIGVAFVLIKKKKSE